MSDPTICALPFGHIFLSEEGKSFPCCYALESGAANLDEDGQPIFVSGRESLELAWNSPTQKEIRRKMMKAERPAACNRCFTLEDHGLQSLRKISNLRFQSDLNMALEKTGADGSQPMEFFSLDIRLGNLCNLRCQMCSPVSSRKMLEDFKFLYPGSDLALQNLGQMTWQQSKELQDALFTHAHGLQEVHFAGGEPFLIPEVERYVSALAISGYAKNIQLSFNTNGTLLPEKLLSLFPMFRSVRLILSLDGLGAVNDYIRFPSQFSRIEKNLQELHRRRIELNLTYVCFNVTVQAHNLFQLPDLIRYLTETYTGFLPFPILGPLRVPECLNVQVLPRTTKEMAAAMLKKLIESEMSRWQEIASRDPQPGGAERFRGHVEGFVDFLLAEDRSDLLPELARFTSVLEKSRGKAPAIPGVGLESRRP